MKSFLKRKQAQVIAALVMAIAAWTMIVGLGLNNGIARAAPANFITIGNKAQLSNNVVSVQVHYKCSELGPAPAIIIQVEQQPVFDAGGNFATCDNYLHTLDVEVSSTSHFFLGAATADELLFDSQGALIVENTRTIKIV